MEAGGRPPGAQGAPGAGRSHRDGWTAGAARAARATGAPAPTWQRLADCPRCVLHRPNLVRTTLTALVVGTVLFCINHLAGVLHGRATTATWVATGISFVVPFLVANLGLLFASRAPAVRAAARPRRPRPARPTWQRLRESPRCVLHRPHLRRTVATALAVGSVYLVVNHLRALTGGRASDATWVEGGLTYLVPFSVANVGVLVGCRTRESPARP